MWFMNKIANPLVCLILRSPLHRLMSSAVLLLTYRGRKSGKEYTLPVQYVQEEHAITILPGSPEHKTWWRALRGGAPVRLLLKGRQLSGNAAVLSGEAESADIAHALDLYLQRFPAAAKMHNVRIDPKEGCDQADLLRSARSTVVVNVDLGQ